MTEVAIRPGASRHGATTGRTERSEERTSDFSGHTVEPCVRARAYTLVTYPNVCGPHRANRGANINHAALYPSVRLYRGCFTHACIYVHARRMQTLPLSLPPFLPFFLSFVRSLFSTLSLSIRSCPVASDFVRLAFSLSIRPMYTRSHVR